jgi:hypothetical protein
VPPFLQTSLGRRSGPPETRSSAGGDAIASSREIIRGRSAVDRLYVALQLCKKHRPPGSPPAKALGEYGNININAKTPA